MTPGLLTTKLHRPSLPPKLVQRLRLIQRLNKGLEAGRRIALVSAPAGFGKTVCASAWVHALDCPVSWLSLEPADDDPGRFFTYLIAALQKVDANVGREIEGALRAGQLPPGEVISTTLGNDIQELEGQFVLVLDDFQVIQDHFILQVLERLVTSLPQPLHLVLLTREDPPLPLARLRANNQLTEIRAGDLRFTISEAGYFLNKVLGLALSPADIAVLETKTEGWVVGLQLAGLSVQDRADPSRFIATLGGSHRFILSYLTEQVLSRQPGEIQHFLLQTAILDKLNSDLCNAVTGRSDGRAVLEGLFNANLFLIPLDDEQRWYRYHHLFADLLRDLGNALQKEKVAELHQRASRWYAQAGMAGEAIQHALAAKDYALAVSLLESHALEMIMQGYAKTVHGWVQAVPGEWSLQSPRTNLALAWMHLLRGAAAQASSYLEQVQAAFSGPQVGAEEKSSLQAEWLVMQSLMLYGQGQVAESKALATRALEIAPERDSRVRSLAYWGLGSVYQSMDDYPHAAEAYRKAIQHGRAAENLIAEMMGTSGLAMLAFEHGQLRLAFEIAAPVSARIERSGALHPIHAVIYGVLGEVCYQWYQIEEGRRYTLRALQLTTLGGYSTGAVFCRVLLSRLAQIEGDLETAVRKVQQASELVQAQAPDHVWQELVSQQVRVYLAQDRLAAAELALQGQGFSFRDRFSFPDLPPNQSVPYSMGLLYNSSLHVLLYRARAGRDLSGLGPGIELAGRLIAGALQGQYLIVALEALVLRAQMHVALGKGEPDLAASGQLRSQADYARALELAEPEGFIGVFVEQGRPVAEALANLVAQNQLGGVQPDYVESILAAFSQWQAPGATHGEQPAPHPPAETGLAALVEPLTERELEVLRLMAEGLKYKEIAARLYVSLNTVRFHVKAVYGKLGVNNRTQAIAAARQLHVL